MKSFINIFALVLCLTPAFAQKEIQQYPLDDRRVYPITVSRDRVTTISFPGPISAIDAANVTVDGRTPALFQIAHNKGSYFFSVRALDTNAISNVNVRWNNKTYALELREGKEPLYSVIFDYPNDRGVRPAPAAVTPERLLALLDKAKAFPLLKQFHPEAVEDVTFVNYATHPPMDYQTYAIRIEEVFRFNPEDTLVFRVTLTNTTAQILRYRPDGFSLRVGERVYPQSISDAAGIIPPKGTASAYFAVTGTPDGGRNDISPKNDFTALLDAIPVVTSPLSATSTNTVAPTNSTVETEKETP
jgi:hypothetical protein